MVVVLTFDNMCFFQNIVELNDTLGCCLAEIVQVQMGNG